MSPKAEVHPALGGSATRNAQSSSSLLADTNERTNRHCRIIYRFKSAIYLTAFTAQNRGTKSTPATLSGNNNEVSRFVGYYTESLVLIN